MSAPDCTLCELPTAGVDVIDDEGNEFCCTGCRDVYETLGDVDVDADAVRERRQGNEDESAADDTEVPVDHEATFLEVDGMHCATCEAFIETVATQTEGVSAASASYVTDTVRIDHDPDAVSTDDLSEAVSGLGYSAYDRDDAFSRRQADNMATARLAVGVLVGMAVMLQYIVIIYPTYFAFPFYNERTLEYLNQAMASSSGTYFFIVIAVLTTVVLFITGKPILRGAYVSAKTRSPNMDLLVAIAAVSAYAYSTLAVIFVDSPSIYYDVTVAIIVIVTVGNHYEDSIKKRATELLSDLTAVQVDSARRLVGGGESDGKGSADSENAGETEEVAIDDLASGDRLLVRAGERIPVDGAGGRGRRRRRRVGHHRRVDAGPEDARRRRRRRLRGRGRLADGRSRSGRDLQPRPRRGARLGPPEREPRRPEARRPAGDDIRPGRARGRAPRRGREPRARQRGDGGDARRAHGAHRLVSVRARARDPARGRCRDPGRARTLHRDLRRHRLRAPPRRRHRRLRQDGDPHHGEMRVVAADLDDGLLRLAAALEERSAHPVGQAIAAVHAGGGDLEDAGAVSDPDAASPAVADGGAAESTEPNDTLPVTDFESHARGVSGVVDGIEVVVGHPDLFDERGWAVPNGIREAVAAARDVGRVPVAVGRDGAAEGVVVVGDELREGWEETVTALADSGVEVVVLTGDDERAATVFREHDAIASVFAGVPPEGKAETVERLKASGQTVMVGDGTNDAPALAAADLGVALGGGTAMAADAADVAIVDDNLDSVATVFELSRAAGRRVKGNIGWALCYNAIAIPLAVTGLLNPLFAAVAMGASSLLVVTNSSRPLLDD